MRIILFFVFLFYAALVFSQSLNIQETIAYLNKLSKDYPINWVDEDATNFDRAMNAVAGYEMSKSYQIEVNSSGVISISRLLRTYNKEKAVDKTELAYGISFDVSQIKKGDISIDLNKSEIYISQFYYEGNGKYDYRKIYLSLNNRNYLKVYFNGLNYLISLLKDELKNKESVSVIDPFLKVSGKTNRAKETKIPLMEDDGVNSVVVSIGGVVVPNFILDSGAGECSISYELAQTLIKKGLIKKADYLINGFYKLADGSIVENKRIVISKMKIGDIIVSDIIASIGVFGSPNLLGQSFLKKFKSWSINNSGNYLIIR